MQKKYDAVLYIDSSINEAADPRVKGTGKNIATGGDKGFTQYLDIDDPHLYTNFSFGNIVRQTLNNMGNGYSCQVADFKKWVVVTVTHSNIMTGRSASKTFLIVFTLDKDGMILTTSNRYRTVSGVEQACSYIRSACTVLQSETQSKII